MTRFEVRLSVKQKEYLEFASRLGGYKSLSDFILTSALNEANLIVTRHRTILASIADKDTFFAALLQPDKPNEHLKAAATRCRSILKRNDD